MAEIPEFLFQLEALCPEVQKQCMFQTSGGEVIDYLDFVFGKDGLDSFQFQNQHTCDDKICPVQPNHFATISNLKFHFPFKWDALQGHLQSQGILVNSLGEPRP